MMILCLLTVIEVAKQTRTVTVENSTYLFLNKVS